MINKHTHITLDFMVPRSKEAAEGTRRRHIQGTSILINKIINARNTDPILWTERVRERDGGGGGIEGLSSTSSGDSDGTGWEEGRRVRVDKGYHID